MISASAVTMRHELVMSLVAGLNPISKVWSRTLMTPYASFGRPKALKNFSRAFQ